MKVYTYKTLEQNLKKNYEVCISVSLFKMNDPYRDFSKYVTRFLNWATYIPSNCFIRLYTDEASLLSKQFSAILSKNIDHLEIFVYDYPEFKLGKSGFHDGTFGTLMRFLPLWDKDLWSNYKINYVWVSDVDIYSPFLDNDILDLMKAHKASIGYYSKACYSKPWVPDDLDFSIGAGKIIFKKPVTVSEYKFKKFLRDILNGKYVWLKDSIKSYYKSIKNNEMLKSISKIKYITYGFDEYYTNVILYSDIEDEKTVVQYNLDLRVLKHNFPSYDKKKILDDLEYKLWTGEEKNNSEFKDYTDDFYNYILETKSFSKLNTRYKICLEDYGKYNSAIKPQSNVLSAFLVVN